MAPPLVQCLVASGPLAIPPRRHDLAVTHLARAIVGQQLSTATARTFWFRIERAARIERLSIVAFLERTRVEELRLLGLSDKKIRAIKALLDHFAVRRLEEATLEQLGHEGRLTELTTIWGVGEWTVDMLSIFHFGEVDIWPRKDGSVQSGIRRLMSWRKVSADRLGAFGRPFAPWRSYLALHVWHWIDNTPA